VTQFVQRFLSNLEAWPDRLFSVEVHGKKLISTEGKRLRAMIEIARHALRKEGVEAGSRVVFVASNSTKWIATDLAILAEGATVVPMYARQSPKELAGMIADADPALLIVENEALETAISKALQKPLRTIRIGSPRHHHLHLGLIG
jgi:long-subunit acyl-CoA synthetase (AMP-forming)